MIRLRPLIFAMVVGALGLLVRLPAWFSGEPRSIAAAQEGVAQDAPDESVSDGVEGFKTVVAPFFKAHCVRCHGAEKSKGEITVHALNGDMSLGQKLDKWESILDMLQVGEMPPATEPQPKAEDVKAVTKWIESGMRDYMTKAKPNKRIADRKGKSN